MKRPRSWIVLSASVLVGLAIAYVDSRPGWDDSAITAVSVFISSGLSAAFLTGQPRPHHAWMSAIAIGVWIPVFEVRGEAGPASLIALVIASLGAILGAVVRRSLQPPRE